MNMTEKIRYVLRMLDEHYPFDDKCFLHYNEPWQLLVATILSAQCTDDRVNMVTIDLFKKYTSLIEIASADLTELESIIRSTGFYHAKAMHILESAGILIKDHNGEIPSEIEKLTTLPGVGRKTANVIRSHIFKIPSIVVDTHVKRVSYRIGLTTSTDPVRAEYDLMSILPESHWIRYNTQIITHGRKICAARKPECEKCFFVEICDKNVPSVKH